MFNWFEFLFWSRQAQFHLIGDSLVRFIFIFRVLRWRLCIIEFMQLAPIYRNRFDPSSCADFLIKLWVFQFFVLINLPAPLRVPNIYKSLQPQLSNRIWYECHRWSIEEQLATELHQLLYLWTIPCICPTSVFIVHENALMLYEFFRIIS